MSRTIAIIPCTNQKSTIPGSAREVWQGSHFQLTLYHAEHWYDEVLVMSYKYGLIDPDFIIEPYDINIQYASAPEKLEWWWALKDQIKEISGDPPDLIAVYTGNYDRQRFVREFIRNGFRNIIIPWENARIGERMQLVYDNTPPFDVEKIGTDEYTLPEDYGAPKKRGRPKKVEPEELEAEWVDD